MHDLQYLRNPLPATQPSIPPTQTPLPTSISLSQATDDAKLSQVTAPPWLEKTLSIVRFLPFVGAVGLLLFKAATWIILLGIGLATIGVGLFFLRSLSANLARDYDAIFAVIFCLAGILLLFQEYQSYGSQEIPISQFLLF